MRFLSTLLASVLGTLIAAGILVLFLVLFVMAISLSLDSVPDVPRGSVLAVDLRGSFPDVSADDPIVRLAVGTTPQDLNRLRSNLRKAAADERIEALWLRFGGLTASWAALEEIREALLHFKESGKPVYASAPSFMMDEADYFVASVADSVFLAPESMFEFNGFHITAEFYASMLERLEVEPQVIRVGTYKSAVEPYTRTDLSDENREQLAALLGAWNSIFTEAVATARGLSASQVQELTENAQVFTATDARAAGLIDDLLYHEEVLDIFRARLGLDADDDVELVDESAYSAISPEDAGLRIRSNDEIAVVFASGAMVSGRSGMDPNPLFGGVVVGSDTFRDAIREAKDRDRVRAIVVRIDSPGGFAPAADEMWHAVRDAAQEKPVLVSMGGYAASGGYWLATAGETIVADPLTITGSIGVFSVFFDLGGLFSEKLGIDFDAVTTSPHADMFSGLRPLQPAERALLERSTQQTYATFLSRVAESRRMSISEVDSLAQGRVWIGRQAQELGLVDTLGTLRTAIHMAASRAGLEEDAYRVRVLPRPPGLLEMLSQRLGASVATTWSWLRYSPAERAALAYFKSLQDVSDMHGRVIARLPMELRVR